MEKPGAKSLPINSAFEPDILVSYRYFKVFRAHAHLSSEQRLMLAVLTDAVECLQKKLNARSCTNHKLFSEAQAWIASPENSWPFSFECICEALNLDPNYLRAGLRQWRGHQKMAKKTRPRVREALRYKTRVVDNRWYSDKRRASSPSAAN
jgi:hypothetical protein